MIPLVNVKNVTVHSSLLQFSLPSYLPAWAGTTDKLCIILPWSSSFLSFLDFCHCLLSVLTSYLFLFFCLSLSSPLPLLCLSNLFFSVFLFSVCFLCTLVSHPGFLCGFALLTFLKVSLGRWFVFEAVLPQAQSQCSNLEAIS